MLVFSFGESQPAASGRADGEGDDVAGSKDGIPEPNLKGDVPRDVKRLQPLKRGGDNALYVVLRVDDLLMRHGIHLPSAPLRRGFFCGCSPKMFFIKVMLTNNDFYHNSTLANGGNPTGRGGPAARMDGVRSVGPEP